MLVYLAACGQIHRIREAEPEEAWVESETSFPAFPQPQNFIEFQGVRGTTNRYYIDATSITLGKDGVVRYTMIVVSAGGARTITYEGMHCEATGQRYYAVGRADGTWAPARTSEWRRFDVQNRALPHGYLFSEAFCPGRNYTVPTVAQAIDGLKHGRSVTYSTE